MIQLLTVREAADLLRVHSETIYRLVRAGRLPAVRRIGRAIRIDANVLAAWIDTGAAIQPRHTPEDRR